MFWTLNSVGWKRYNQTALENNVCVVRQAFCPFLHRTVAVYRDSTAYAMLFRCSLDLSKQLFASVCYLHVFTFKSGRGSEKCLYNMYWPKSMYWPTCRHHHNACNICIVILGYFLEAMCCRYRTGKRQRERWYHINYINVWKEVLFWWQEMPCR